MMRTLSVLLGALVLAAGVILALAPGMIPPEILDPLLSVEVGEYVEASLLAVAVVVLLVSLLARVSTRALPRDPVRVEPKDQSDRTVSTVGADFDTLVEDHDLYRRGTTVPEPSDEPGLTETLVATLARREGCSSVEARELLESGGWTEDRDAELLFATDPELTGSERFRAWLRPEATFERRVRAATDELARLSEELNDFGSGGHADSDGRSEASDPGRVDEVDEVGGVGGVGGVDGVDGVDAPPAEGTGGSATAEMGGTQ